MIVSTEKICIDMDDVSFISRNAIRFKDGSILRDDFSGILKILEAKEPLTTEEKCQALLDRVEALEASLHDVGIPVLEKIK